MSNIANNRFARVCTFRYDSTSYDFEFDSGRISVIIDADLDKLAGGSHYTTFRGYYLQFDLSFRFMRRIGTAQFRAVLEKLLTSTVEFKPFPDATLYAVKLLTEDVTFADVERTIVRPKTTFSLITTNRLTSLPSWLDNNKQITL